MACPQTHAGASHAELLRLCQGPGHAAARVPSRRLPPCALDSPHTCRSKLRGQGHCTVYLGGLAPATAPKDCLVKRSGLDVDRRTQEQAARAEALYLFQGTLGRAGAAPDAAEPRLCHTLEEAWRGVGLIERTAADLEACLQVMLSCRLFARG